MRRFRRERYHGESGAKAAKASTNGSGPAAGSGYRAKVKYRDPETNETWSGRGLMASWLKRKQDAGEDIEKYRV